MRVNLDSVEGRIHPFSAARTDRNRAPQALVAVGTATETDSDATWVAFLLSRCSLVRARDFARAMAERTAWDIELDWHDHWERVAALLADQRACIARDGSMKPG
jgi:hypothetical protein